MSSVTIELIMETCFALFSVVLVYVLAVEAQNQSIKPLVSAIYFFGDSTIDAGNNNWLHTNVKSNFPPYGKDFPGGEPTGRFTNGKLITDMLAGLLGLSDVLPASLDTTFTGQILLAGASFGSAGAGLDDETSLRVSVMTMRQQVENFKDYRSKLSDYVGLENASNIVSGALFAISIGTDDFVNNYFQNSQTRKRYSLSQYQDLLIGSLRESLQSFIDDGATKIGVVGLPAFGCLPLQITLHNFMDRSCYEYFNDVARSFNAKISDLVESMRGSLPGVQIFYLDIYYELLEIVHNASLYGFEVAGKGCCGTGLVETSVMCNKATPTCPDASKYVFWDGFHPTTAAYNIIANDLFQQIVRGLEQ